MPCPPRGCDDKTKMKNNEMRKQKVLDLLLERKRLTIEEAMKETGVSESTVRRIFLGLEREGVAIRTYGGICCRGFDEPINEYSFEAVSLDNPEKKARIGAEAEKLIAAGDTVYLDSGTTVMSLCAEIDRLFRAAKSDPVSENTLAARYGGVTFFTHSLVNFNLLKHHTKVFLLGGEYRDARRDFCGYLTEEAVGGLRFTKCFVGADGFSEDSGLLASDFGTARINRLVVDRSGYRILLVDASKYRRGAMVCYAPFGSIDCIVADASLPEPVSASLTRNGVKLILA